MSNQVLNFLEAKQEKPLLRKRLRGSSFSKDGIVPPHIELLERKVVERLNTLCYEDSVVGSKKQKRKRNMKLDDKQEEA